MSKLTFDPDLYSRYALQKAIDDYKVIARITLSVVDGEYICSFESSVYDIERVVDEFSNYVLDLTAQEGLNDGMD